jgi:predicted alpha/beta-fold hydrolase
VAAPVNGPIVLILHGLEGSSGSGYVAHTCALLVARGAWPVALNFRSCSGEPNRLLRSYHSGDTTDVGFVVDLLRSENPGVPVGVIGYSLGGNVLLCYLEESGPGAVDAAVAVSVPFDLAASARKLEQGMGRVYSRHFLRSIKDKIKEKAGRIPDAAPLARTALAARTIRRIDDAWTAPVHGFADAAQYYSSCSSVSRLAGIRTPTLLLQAADDPFLPMETLDRVRRLRNPSVTCGFTRRGGHLGYLGARSSVRLWAEARATDWLIDRLPCGTEG